MESTQKEPLLGKSGAPGDPAEDASCDASSDPVLRADSLNEVTQMAGREAVYRVAYREGMLREAEAMGMEMCFRNVYGEYIPYRYAHPLSLHEGSGKCKCKRPDGACRFTTSGPFEGEVVYFVNPSDGAQTNSTFAWCCVPLRILNRYRCLCRILCCDGTDHSPQELKDLRARTQGPACCCYQ